MQKNVKSKKIQTTIGIFLVAVFVASSVGANGSFSVIRSAFAGYGYSGGSEITPPAATTTSSKHHHHKKKKKKTSQTTVVKKVAQFKVFQTPANVRAYNTVSAIKKTNPSKFRALQNVFNRYTTVSGKLRVQPNAQTLASINMFRSYNGYSTYLNYVSKLKK